MLRSKWAAFSPPLNQVEPVLDALLKAERSTALHTLDSSPSLHPASPARLAVSRN